MVHNLIVTGVGGQGNVLASRVIATAAVRSGFFVSVGETFGASQRGGSVMSHIRISAGEAYGPLIPQGKSSFIIGFEPVETLRTLIAYGGKETGVIMNLHFDYPLAVTVGEKDYPEMEKIKQAVRENSGRLVCLEATELAATAGVPVAMNMVMTGAFARTAALPISADTYENVISGLFSGEILQLNLKAFRAGSKAVTTN